MKRMVYVALALVACGKGGDAENRGSKPAEPAATEAPAATELSKKANEPARPADKPARPKVSKEQRRAYRAHLRAGRKLGKKEKWGEAVVELEAALKAIPMDGRALSELGWAAFKAGDYEKAKRANEDSARVASEPKVRAASLYNLGRVAEAMKDTEAAAGYYRESLKLRPHDAVSARLEKLGKPAPTPGAVGEDSLPCTKPVASPELACACLNKGYEEELDGREGECELLSLDAPAETRVARVRVSDGAEYEYFLLYQREAGWEVIANLGYLYEGGVAGVFNEMDVNKIEKLSRGKRDILWVELTEQGSDTDMGINEISDHKTRNVTLCVLTGKGAPRCALRLPLIRSYGRYKLDEEGDDEVEEDMRDLQTPGLPIHSERSFEVRVGDDGTATVVLVKGEADDETKPMLGPHKLW